MKESKTVEMIKNANNKQAFYAIHFMIYVELIKDISIQNFVRNVLINHSPNYFWTTPASKSGKHHNEDECVDG